MDDERYREVIEQDADRAVQDAFKRKKTLVPTSMPIYPNEAERVYTGLLTKQMNVIRVELKKELPKIMTAYKTEFRADATFGFTSLVTSIVGTIMKRVVQAITGFEVVKSLQKVGVLTQSRAITEWKKMVNSTLKVNIYEDYYQGDYFKDNVSEWVTENVIVMQGLTTDTLNGISQVIYDGYSKGLRVEELQKQIQAKFDMDKRRAKFIARDQISTLNSQITQAYQKDAGITKYKWYTCHDERVRESHKALDGKIFEWDNPPEIWYKTKNGKVNTGRRCNPGEDYCCRCVAIPVFEKDKVKLPVKNDKGE